MYVAAGEAFLQQFLIPTCKYNKDDHSNHANSERHGRVNIPSMLQDRRERKTILTSLNPGTQSMNFDGNFPSPQQDRPQGAVVPDLDDLEAFYGNNSNEEKEAVQQHDMHIPCIDEEDEEYCNYQPR
ncbi:hypothetical protein NDU88_002772 [Pleurodeles waltl]|uniref:Uncharacterized protein n=1 Tax=Pleurodeles waltl TaxID=8319 RepID=A0AAV7MC12_PLEWA|nr:hypothetical protein NDU88_002772 [Pleurodeles waltl]